MSTRLTNDIRDSIARAVLRHRFQDEVEALVADRAAFAEEVYNDIYRKSDREKMAALPKGWLPECNSVRAQFGDFGRTYESFPFDGSLYGSCAKVRKDGPRERSEKRMFSRHAHGCMKVYESTHKLTSKYVDLSARADDLKEAIDAAERQIKAALQSVGTIKRLIEGWPEVAPFAAKFEDAPKNLPSVPTAQLNELLDLPVAA